MNDSWGFNLLDNNFKSVKSLVQYLVKAAGNNANFLLNVGPMPNGKFHSRFISTLKEIGKWLDKTEKQYMAQTEVRYLPNHGVLLLKKAIKCMCIY